jgi:hypothetical protein
VIGDKKKKERRSFLHIRTSLLGSASALLWVFFLSGLKKVEENNIYIHGTVYGVLSANCLGEGKVHVSFGYTRLFLFNLLFPCV